MTDMEKELEDLRALYIEQREEVLQLRKDRATLRLREKDKDKRLADVKEILKKATALAKKVDKLASDAMNDPIHDHMYKEEMAEHGLKAFELLGKIKKAVGEEGD